MSRPSTPIRRISRGSLRAFSLSQSQSQSQLSADAPVDPLAHLKPLLQETADALDVLADNFTALNQVNDYLDGFNESFASFLYGLKGESPVHE